MTRLAVNGQMVDTGTLAPGTRLIAVVRDCEIVGELPRDPHDIAMTHALTPGGGLVRLGEC